MVGVGAGLGLVMEGTSCGALLKELQVFNLLWKFALQFLPRYASLLLNVDVIFVFLDSLVCLVNSPSLLFFGFYRFFPGRKFAFLHILAPFLAFLSC